MKPLVTAIGIAALLMISAGAYAHNNVWTDGNSTGMWRDLNNWSGAGYPGDGTDVDTATIDESTDTAAFSVTLDALLAASISSLTMGDGASGSMITLSVTDSDANANETLLTVSGTFLVQEGDDADGAYIQKSGDDAIEAGTLDIDARPASTSSEDVTLKISAGTLDVAGPATLYASGANDSDATLWHAAGTLVIDDLDLRGGQSVSTFGDRGKAVAHFDVASGSGLTINDDVYTSGDVDIQCDANVSVDGLYVGSSSDESDTYKLGSSTLSVDGLIIRGSSSGNTYFTVSAGNLDVN